MNTTPFVIERVYDAPVEKVWKALTESEEMKQWYFDIPGFKPEVGFEFSFEGGDENNRYVHLCRVTEVIPQKKLSHTWQYEGQPEQTLARFELSEAGNQTRVRLTHEGLEKIAHHGPAFATNNFAQGWTAILGTSLKQYLEK